MNDRQLEEQIRSLVPAPLPPDLAARMAEPPHAPGASRRRQRRRAIPAVLAILTVSVWVGVWWRPSADPVTPKRSDPPAAVTVHVQESDLLECRRLEVFEFDGRTWEIAEQQWRDRDAVLCSASPLQMRIASTRRELVCRPVHFD